MIYIRFNIYYQKGTMSRDFSTTVMSLLEATYLIEAPPNKSSSCHKIVAPPQNRRAQRF